MTNILKFDPDRQRKRASSGLTLGLGSQFATIDASLKQFQAKVKPFRAATLPSANACRAAISYLQDMTIKLQAFEQTVVKAVHNMDSIEYMQAGVDFYGIINKIFHEAEQLKLLAGKFDSLQKHIVLYFNYPNGRKQEHAKVLDLIARIEQDMRTLPNQWR